MYEGDSEEELFEQDDVEDAYFEMTDVQKKEYRKMRRRIRNE